MKAGRYRRTSLAAVACAAVLLASAAVTLAAFRPIDRQLRISRTGSDSDGLRAVNPQLAFNPERNEYLAVWRSDVLSAGSFEVFGQRLSLTGARLGSRFRISNTTAAGPDRTVGEIGVAYDRRSNRYLVVWWGDGLATDNQFEIFGRLVADTGGALGSDFRVSHATDSSVGAVADADGPVVAFDPNADRYLVAWRADEGTTDNEFEIWGQLVTAAGGEVGPDFRISNVGSDGDTTRGVPASRHRPEAAAVYEPLADQYLVAWPGNQLARGKYEIYGQRLDAGGNQLGGDFRISNTGPAGDGLRDATSVDLAYDSHDNEYLAVFNADRTAHGPGETPNGNEEEVFGQRVGPGGAQRPSATDFRISTTGPDGNGSYDSNAPSVAYGSPDDGYLVTWTSNAVRGESDIFGQRLGSRANEVGRDFRISRGIGLHFFSDVASAGRAREYLTAWEGNAAGAPDYEVYARRLGRGAACAGRSATRQGTRRPDTIDGGSGADVIALLGGKDSARGGGGNDVICGGGGSGDTVRGNGGNDFLDGGPGGGDRCIGGPGADSFGAGCEIKSQ